MIYLDHTATETIEAEVLDEYLRLLREANFNPAARYKAGRETRKALETSKEGIKKLLGAKPNDRLVITSGATESTNTILKGLHFAYDKRVKRILATKGEHPATARTLQFLERQGFEIVRLPLKDGHVDMDALDQALEEPFLLGTFIFVQNEMGALNPLSDIVALCLQKQRQMKLHVDAVQAIGKVPFDFAALDIDAASFSGHKFGAPKGIGYLLLKQNLLLEPLLHGGGQQGDYRSGTENYPLVEASRLALERTLEGLPEKLDTVRARRDFFLKELDRLNVHYTPTVPLEKTVPGILSLGFPELRAEPLMNALSAEGIYVSIGSACSSEHPDDPGVYEALGIDREAARHILRFSINWETTEDELSTVAAAIEQTLRIFKP